MELQIDFSAHLPQHLTPSYDKVVSLLNQTVQEWPRGAAMLTKERKGVFAIKIWDKQKAENLLNKKITYYYEGEQSNKKVEVRIQEKPKYLRYVNPKYVTMQGFNSYPLERITNDQIDRILESFGDIIVPTDDVYAEIFLTGKKKVRIDLNKGKEIPRDLFVQFTTDSGSKHSSSIRCYYKNQPYNCKRCAEEHIGDCPAWLEEKAQAEKIKVWKEANTKTAFIGDSNFRCINEKGLMASVTASTGAKIGHIANQISFEKLDKIENVIINAGQNCINDIEKLDKVKWQERTRSEISEMEKQIVNLMKEGKRIFVMAVPPVPTTTSTPQRKEGRKYINKNLKKLVQIGITKGAPGTAVFLEENEGNFNPATDFTDERHLASIAIERTIRKIEEMLPADQKLRSTNLTEHATCKPYKGCYGTYPIGCSYCTRMEHQEHECKAKTGQEKRNHSTDDDAANQSKFVRTD